MLSRTVTRTPDVRIGQWFVGEKRNPACSALEPHVLRASEYLAGLADRLAISRVSIRRGLAQSRQS